MSTKRQDFRYRHDKFPVFDRAYSAEDIRNNILVVAESIVKTIYSFNEKQMNIILQN